LFQDLYVLEEVALRDNSDTRECNEDGRREGFEVVENEVDAGDLEEGRLIPNKKYKSIDFLQSVRKVWNKFDKTVSFNF
jgi:hypothetical protein